MKKTAFFALLAAALLSGGFVSTASAQTRIATIDIKKIFESYYKARETDQQIHEQRTKVKKELDDRLDAYKNAMREVQKLDEDIKRPELSATVRAGKERDRADKVARLAVMQREGNEFGQAKEKELQDMAMATRNAVLEDINRVVAARAQAEHYDYVFDRSAQSMAGFPVLVYAQPSTDFTNDVLTALNKTKGSGEVKPAEAARPATTKKPK
jgi:Skp family chaperone for outer membrane proteins